MLAGHIGHEHAPYLKPTAILGRHCIEGIFIVGAFVACEPRQSAFGAYLHAILTFRNHIESNENIVGGNAVDTVGKDRTLAISESPYPLGPRQGEIVVVLYNVHSHVMRQHFLATHELVAQGAVSAPPVGHSVDILAYERCGSISTSGDSTRRGVEEYAPDLDGIPPAACGAAYAHISAEVEVEICAVPHPVDSGSEQLAAAVAVINRYINAVLVGGEI